MTGQALDAVNTLGVPSRARLVRVVRTEQDVIGLDRLARADGVVVLGGGSNVVLGDWLNATVCLIRNRGIEAVENGSGVLVTAAAGECWHDLVRWTLGRGYAGLENLALIPGSVGAAPVQNIGAYGAELEQRFVELTAYDLDTGKRCRFGRDACRFGYRTSRFKADPGRFIILAVTLSLDRPTRAGAPVITTYEDVRIELERMGVRRPGAVQVAEAVIRVRRRKLPDPRLVPNVGSFFKNPAVSAVEFERLRSIHEGLNGHLEGRSVKLSAAQLIDRCGLKSDVSAPVRVWHRQPLVLINPERRPAREVLAQADVIRQRVQDAFGVRLELEPDTFGC